MVMSGIPKSRVSRLCEKIDQRVKAFLKRPIKGDRWIVIAVLKPRWCEAVM